MTFPLERLRQTEYVAQRLMAAGIHDETFLEKARWWAKSAERLLEDGVPPGSPAHACFVPGRIEVLGKHTDYVGGRSLLAASQQGVCLLAVARPDQQIRIRSLEMHDATSFAVNSDRLTTSGSWSAYPQTVARRLASNFPGYDFGAEIAFCSDLPIAAGMSSSSALMIATFTALVACGKLEDSNRYREQICSCEELATYLACVENGQSFRDLSGDHGVGTFGGSEDQTAIFCCAPGCLKQYSFCPTRHESTVPLHPECAFVIAASGVVAEKTGAAMAKYNRLSRLAAAGAAIWRAETGRNDEHLEAALSSSSDAPDRLRDVLRRARHPEFSAAQLGARLEHFQAESREIIPAAVAALGAGELAHFGRSVDHSQRIAVQLLGNQVPETEFLPASARDLGAIAASAFGAGFGGSVWALVADDQIASFLPRWRESYANRFPAASQNSYFFSTKPGRPVWQLGN